MGNDALIHDRVSVNSVRIIRPRGAPQGALRDFEADIEGTAEADGELSVIGGISGCLSWWAWLPDLTDASRTAGSIAETIAAAIEIGELSPTEPESGIEVVLIIEHFWLEPQWRGNRLSSRIFDQLIDLLLLTPENTLVLTYLEPQPAPTPTLGAHQDTQHKLHAAFAQAGFEQWRQRDAWWMHPNSQSWQHLQGASGLSSRSLEGPVVDHGCWPERGSTVDSAVADRYYVGALRSGSVEDTHR